MATKKYEVGGMTDTETCGGPGKPRCRQKFKSKGKSKETKGSILGTLGAIAGGIGAYGAYKKLKKEQKGGITKYQGGGSTQSKKMADLRKKYGDIMMDDYREHAKNVANQVTHDAAKGFSNVNKLIKNKKGGVTKYQNGGIADLKEVTITAKKKKYNNGDAASSKVRPVDDKTTKQASKYKTGGMVNPNAKLQAAKSAGSKGVKSGVNPRAAASKVARGRSGGTSTAPKTATPRAKYGMSVKRK